MKQSRPNHLMILSEYKSQLDQIDLIKIASTFVDKNEGGDVHLEGSNFRFFLFCTDYISQFFPPKMSSVYFIFHLINTQYL